LGAINRIIRAISEAATGEVPEIEVRQISSSDPLLFFGMDVVAIGAIGAAITWALNTWKQVEEIRKIRNEAEGVDAFSEDDIKEMFDDKIQKTIDIAIEGKVDELLGSADGNPGRPHEQRTDLTWALESLMALIERGLKVEIRFLPPQPEPAEEGEEAEIAPEFQTLSHLAQQLVFRIERDRPVTELPPPEPPDPGQDQQE